MTFGGTRVSDAALVWPQVAGHFVLTGPNTAAGEPGAELSDPSHRAAVGCHHAVARMTGDSRPTFCGSAEFGGDAQSAALAKLRRTRRSQ